MTSIAPITLQISNPFPSTLNPPKKLHHLPLPLRAAADDADSSSKENQQEDQPPTPATSATAVSDPSFESRLSQIRIKYRSGTGKKAEQRRSKKSGGGGAVGKKKTAAVTLPPVPLRDPVTAGGMKVELGFSPYSERINGRLAALGLAALVLVELGSGKGVFSYHAPPIIFIQIYTAIAASCLFIKYEKERVSVWPQKLPSVDDESSVGD